MRHPPLLTLALAAGLAAGCGSDAGGGSDAGPTGPTVLVRDPTPVRTTAPASGPAASGRAGTTIRLARSRYGRILFNRAGQAIYLFARERSSRSRCYGACAAAWPPVLTRSAPRAGEGIDAALLGTTRRRGGARQVTYNGHPLYYYVHDGRNEVRCHNVREFGGLWLVLDRRGHALR